MDMPELSVFMLSRGGSI